MVSQWSLSGNWPYPHQLGPGPAGSAAAIGAMAIAAAAINGPVK
jgi:hypothetical protein